MEVSRGREGGMPLTNQPTNNGAPVWALSCLTRIGRGGGFLPLPSDVIWDKEVKAPLRPSVRQQCCTHVVISS